MSFREKSAWACLLTTVGVFVPYYGYVIQLESGGGLRMAPVIGAFIGAVAVQVVLQIIAHVGFAIGSRPERKDERDLAIESRSFRIAYYVLASTVGLVTTYIFIVGATPIREDLMTPALTSQVLLSCFILAEVTRYLTRAISYRIGG